MTRIANRHANIVDCFGEGSVDIAAPVAAAGRGLSSRQRSSSDGHGSSHQQQAHLATNNTAGAAAAAAGAAGQEGGHWAACAGSPGPLSLQLPSAAGARIHTCTVPVLSLEYADGGDLLSAVHAAGARGLGDTERTRRGAAQLASALEFCHAHGVAHRDIKPENVLLFEPQGDVDIDAPATGSTPRLQLHEQIWKLADFGASSISSRDPSECSGPTLRIESSRAIGSTAYAAPEVVALMRSPSNRQSRPPKGAADGSNSSKAHDYEVYGVDVWSFGVTLFVAASGRMPFKLAAGSDAAFLGFCAASQPKVLSPRAQTQAPLWKWPSHFSDELINLLAACLQVDTRLRPSMSQVRQTPWLQHERQREPLLPAITANTSHTTSSTSRCRSPGSSVPGSNSATPPSQQRLHPPKQHCAHVAIAIDSTNSTSSSSSNRQSKADFVGGSAVHLYDQNRSASASSGDMFNTIVQATERVASAAAATASKLADNTPVAPASMASCPVAHERS